MGSGSGSVKLGSGSGSTSTDQTSIRMHFSSFSCFLWFLSRQNIAIPPTEAAVEFLSACCNLKNCLSVDFCMYESRFSGVNSSSQLFRFIFQFGLNLKKLEKFDFYFKSNINLKKNSNFKCLET